MKSLYKPENEVELAMLRSILDGEDISHFVHNDHFGSLKIGPQIDLFNAKMIMVGEEDYERARELIVDFLDRTKKGPEAVRPSHGLADKIRMIVEFLAFGWFVPGRAGKSTRRMKENPDADDIPAIRGGEPGNSPPGSEGP